jgi:hypothetical protein
MSRPQGYFRCSLVLLCMIVIGCLPGESQTKSTGVRVVANESAQRVDVLVDGKPFTSYIWPNTLKKPVLYPLRTATGTVITRGFPLEPRPGERVDHPHHVGLWFNYGDVNKLDFWNNSDEIKPEVKHKYGSIRHSKIKSVKSGKERGELEVEMEWLAPDGKVILREETLFIFRATKDQRAIDRLTKLTALDEGVVFADNKEGVLGIRVARQLEQPSDKPEVFTDASGKATAVAKLDNTGVSGLYTLAILDHPKNPGFPTYWHARGYGLFAANPLGQAVFSNGKEKLNFTLEPKQSVTFRHRILIISGKPSTDEMESQYRHFTSEMK